jgi:hypothetical protein
MKKLLILLVVLGMAIPSNAGKTKKSVLTLSYVFTNIVEGYDHNSMGKVFIDDVKVFETGQHKESEKQTFTVNTTRGEHTIRVEVWNEYEGEWELHSMDNDYSIDAYFEDSFTLKKGKHTLDVVFDIDSEATYTFE